MLALGLVTLVLSFAPGAAACTAIDEKGEPFPTCFDPGNGLELGVLGHGRATTGSGLAYGPQLHGGILIRTDRESVSKEGTTWFNEHRFVETDVTPELEHRAIAVTAYQGNFRRHLKEGFLLVPSTPPIRLPFPFDFSINVSALRYERRVFEGDGYTVETGRAAILVDPVRSPSGKLRLAFGPAVSHQLRVTTNDVRQEFSPLTSLYAELIGETDDGWWNVRATALAGYLFSPDGNAFLRVRSQLSIDRLILALDDQPLAVRLAGTYVRADAGLLHKSEWTVSLGLVLRLLSPAG